MFSDILVEMLSSLIGISSTTLKQLFQKADLLKQNEQSAKLLADKIEELTTTLHASSELMSEIEAEFEKQKISADKWKEEAATSEIIASLNQKEVAAVSKIFGGQLKAESKVSSRWALFWNVVFCAIGLVGGFLISKYLL